MSSALAGCNSEPASHAPSAKGTRPIRGGDLVVSVRAEPRSFTWYTSQDATTHLIGFLTQARLFRVNGSSQDLEPALAENWTRSEDGLRYAVKLRPDITFSDGAPLTADDVVFSLAAAYDPQSVLADLMQIAGKRLRAEAVGVSTVNITFPGPYGPGLRIFDNLPILPRHKLESALKAGTFGASWGISTPVSDVVCLGPFVISEYTPGERLVFTRNAHYFRKDPSGTQLPYLDRIVVEIVPDQNGEILRLQAGQLDVPPSELRPEDYASLKRSADQGSIQLLDLGIAADPDGLWINLTANAFANDPRRAWIQRDELRQAISLAVDRQVFADTVFLGAATPVFGPITPGNKLWYSEEVPHAAHDRERAKALLAAIGLEDRNGDGTLEDSHGVPAHLTLLTSKGQTALERGSTVIRDEVKKIGLAIDVVALEGNALVQKFLSGKDYDAVYFHLSTSDMDPAMNSDFWLSSGAAHVWNLGQKAPSTEWESEIDALMTKQMTTLEDSERRRLFVGVQKIFANHLPMVHFAAPRVFVGASARMFNLTPAVSRPQLLWAADTIAVKH